MSTARLVLIAGIGLSLTACVDIEMRTVLEGDGSGTLYTKQAFTPKFVEVLHKIDALDPSQKLLEQTVGAMLQPLDKKTQKKLKKAGLKILEYDVQISDTAMSSVAKVRFSSLAALDQLDKLYGGNEEASPDVALTSQGSGYRLAFVGQPPSSEPPASEEEQDPETAMQMLGIMGELMGEMASFRMVVSIDVPGEVTAFSPDLGAANSGGNVTWTFDAATLMNMGMEMAESGGEPDFGGFAVDFQGITFPTSALSAAK